MHHVIETTIAPTGQRIDKSTMKPASNPVPIADQSFNNTDQPTVTVRVTTYNHRPYIEKCLDGILMQRTTFPVEIVVYDDASSDGTADVVRSYSEKYPLIFKLCLQKRNQYSLGIKPIAHVLPLCSGKYIAICEGDDYWRDPLKLQIQVNYLEEHPSCVICGHDAITVDKDDNIIQNAPAVVPEHHKKDHSSEELILRKGWIPPLTRVYRNIIRELPVEFYKCTNGDAFMISLLGHHGYGKYMSGITPAAYRRHSGGIWSSATNLEQKEQKIITALWIKKYYAKINKPSHARYYEERFVSNTLDTISTKRLAKEIIGRFWTKK